MQRTKLLLTEVNRRTRMSEARHRRADKVPGRRTLPSKPPSEVSVEAKIRHHSRQVLFPLDLSLVCIQTAALPIIGTSRRKGRRRIGPPNPAVGGRVRVELTLPFAFGLC